MSLSIQERRNNARGDVERYADGDLRARLDWGEGEIVINDPPHGARSLIYFAHPPSGKSVAIQAFDNAKEARRFVQVLKLARTHDLPVPHLIHSSLDWASSIFGRAIGGLAVHYTYLVTEFAPGSDLAIGSESSGWDFAAPLAGAIARLHAARSPRWGKPGRLKRSSIRGDWRSSVESRLKDLGRGEQATKGIDTNDIERLRKWFAAAIDSIDEQGEFNLCHHHLAADDILYDPESGRVTIVDCASLQFSRAARDLASLRMGLFAGADEAWAIFSKTYDAAMPGREIATIGAELQLFEAFYLLVKLRSAIGNADRFETRLRPLLDRVGTD